RDAMAAADALIAAGARRVLVTDGPAPAVAAQGDQRLSVVPPAITARRITGAGDTFMAAHIAAELTGVTGQAALARAVAAAAHYVSAENTS
uniref:PfkB family carbohydrate kinase n=1 Tax=Roseicyclus sp. TaxID=1914329 RepID=UPI003F6D47E1